VLIPGVRDGHLLQLHALLALHDSLYNATTSGASPPHMQVAVLPWDALKRFLHADTHVNALEQLRYTFSRPC